MSISMKNYPELLFLWQQLLRVCVLHTIRSFRLKPGNNNEVNYDLTYKVDGNVNIIFNIQDSLECINKILKIRVGDADSVGIPREVVIKFRFSRLYEW